MDCDPTRPCSDARRSPAMTSIWWIRDDLRLHDNPALLAAAADGEVLAVHIDEEISGVRPLGGAARWWLHHSLSALAGSLREHGVPLVLLRGDPEQQIPALVEEVHASAVLWNRRYHEPKRAADARLKASLRRCRMSAWRASTATCCTNRGRSPPRTAGRKRSTPRSPAPAGRAPRRASPTGCPTTSSAPRNRCVRAATRCAAGCARRRLSRSSHVADGSRRRPTGQAGCARTGPPARRADGAAARTDRGPADRLCRGPGATGDSGHHQPLAAPPLRRGLSPDPGRGHQSRRAGRGTGPETFRSELLWREFAWHRLFHLPDLATQNVRPQFDDFDWREDDAALRAWQAGAHRHRPGRRRDAGAVGDRLDAQPGAAGRRSFLTKNLRLHWRLGEEWFWDTLVDADDASNPFNWKGSPGPAMTPPRTSASSTPSGSRNGSTPRVTTCVGGCPRWRTSPRSGWRRSSI